ncbi:uncharacterized protein LOC128862524 [Anastrepha ludens]|uniref:uncharacterized protein LOC128862524 n=1 Tax=Anastrepha ludens TaxID=28586 RepID=UPI0023AFDA09|nr:uncharacterized protein LOC128862524 [Anastrepha ludens]
MDVSHQRFNFCNYQHLLSMITPAKSTFEKVNTHKNNGWSIVFTDGSRTEGNVAFSITSEDGIFLSLKAMFPYSSIFSVEAAAIHEAMVLSIQKKTNTIICSDSLSVIQAASNHTCNKWETVNQIRHSLIKNSKSIKLLWVPGHTGIEGNTYADNAAKFACNAPIIISPKTERLDIKRHINTCIIHKQRQSLKNYKH